MGLGFGILRGAGGVGVRGPHLNDEDAVIEMGHPDVVGYWTMRVRLTAWTTPALDPATTSV